MTVRLRDVHKCYGPRDVLAGVSLDLAPGARLGLIGPAASGKTVLCKLVCGLEQPDRGSVEVPTKKQEPVITTGSG